MLEIQVDGKTRVGEEVFEYAGTVVQFESINEYREYIKTEELNGKDQTPEERALVAINDYEKRAQTNKLRNAVKPKTTNVLNALKKEAQAKIDSGEVTQEQINAALASVGIALD